ncbi:MAG: type 4a pilus biogenesis protein PilO [Acidobacteriota bacterium]|jgi:type IV pilus assembly protein PilO|nr:type 4a pilus biogenesis protein PilO [Acidobacteriota bacterium]NLT34201.1 type 4a pilus biogenesis protein PilO [Acidobacteriota bacterium]
MAISNFRFENLSRTTQICVLAALVLCLSFVFYMYYLKDRIKQHNQIRAEIQKLERSVQQGTAIETQLVQFKKDLAELEQRLAVLQSILPSEKETPSLLRGIQQMAAASNLKINKFQPRAMVPRDFYSDWPIDMVVEGNYHGLGLFFEKVSQATRIIDVGTLSLENTKDQTDPSRTLIAGCTATTYVFRDTPMDQANDNSTKKETKR